MPFRQASDIVYDFVNDVYIYEASDAASALVGVRNKRLQLCFALQTLLYGTGFRFAGEWTELNTPDRAVLRYAARDGELLAQTLLILLCAGLVADCANLNYVVSGCCCCRCGDGSRRGWRGACGGTYRRGDRCRCGLFEYAAI